MVPVSNTVTQRYQAQRYQGEGCKPLSEHSPEFWQVNLPDGGRVGAVALCKRVKYTAITKKLETCHCHERLSSALLHKLGLP
jgi:hypothetical protein